MADFQNSGLNLGGAHRAGQTGHTGPIQNPQRLPNVNIRKVLSAFDSGRKARPATSDTTDHIKALTQKIVDAFQSNVQDTRATAAQNKGMSVSDEPTQKMLGEMFGGRDSFSTHFGEREFTLSYSPMVNFSESRTFSNEAKIFKQDNVLVIQDQGETHVYDSARNFKSFSSYDTADMESGFSTVSGRTDGEDQGYVTESFEKQFARAVVTGGTPVKVEVSAMVDFDSAHGNEGAYELRFSKGAIASDASLSHILISPESKVQVMENGFAVIDSNGGRQEYHYSTKAEGG